MNTFFEQVYAVVAQIPYGNVASYGQIARALGRPRSAREVGRAMRHCPQNVPCHRVVMADGSVCGGVHAEARKAMLKSEGVAFASDDRVAMSVCRWME